MAWNFWNWLTQQGEQAPEFIAGTSDTIHRVTYDPERGDLEVLLRDGGWVKYMDVPEATYDLLLHAHDLDRAVREYVVGNFSFTSSGSGAGQFAVPVQKDPYGGDLPDKLPYDQLEQMPPWMKEAEEAWHGRLRSRPPYLDRAIRDWYAGLPVAEPVELEEFLRQQEALGERPEEVADYGLLNNFAYRGEWMALRSSNVRAAQFHYGDNRLTLEFHNGWFYDYADVPLSMALELVYAPSAGRWVWQELRRMGTVYGHKKVYTFLSGPSSGQPRWMQDAGTRAAHEAIGPAGEEEYGTIPGTNIRARHLVGGPPPRVTD